MANRYYYQEFTERIKNKEIYLWFFNKIRHDDNFFIYFPI